jgi:UDP-N-acetylglucosamine 4,6-dehydratase
MHVSTDKAVEPINLYGATKMVAEKLFIDGNVYSPNKTKFSICRYGNVLGSRGSIIQVIENCIKENKPIPVTDVRMTRFFVTLKLMAEFIVQNILSIEGGEIFIPKMYSINIIDLIKYFAGDNYDIKQIGIRQGEKIHESIVSINEAKHTKYFSQNSMFIISDKYEEDTLTNEIKSNSKECLLHSKSIKEYLNTLLEEKQW